MTDGAEGRRAAVDEAVDRITETLLYEGYALYPYRASALKNRHRFNFGVLHPPGWSPSEASSLQVEVPVVGPESASLSVELRFLHLVDRTVHRAADGRSVARLEVGDRVLVPWQEALPVRECLPRIPLAEAAGRRSLAREASEEREPVLDRRGRPAAEVLRARRALEAELEWRVEPEAGSTLDERVWRFSLRLGNRTACSAEAPRDEALLRSLVSVHVVIRVSGGRLVSLLEPDDEDRAVAEACRNVGVFPVLVGARGERSTMLASPILLYDHPQVAAESEGDRFDATEIDEMLALRTATLTLEERREVASVDDRVRRMLERTGALERDRLDRLHGRLTLERSFSVGDRVRVSPRAGGDVVDLTLRGRTARVDGVEVDVDGRRRVAVLIEDDLALALGLVRRQSRRFFFDAEELEAVDGPAGADAPSILVAGIGNVFLGDDAFGVEAVRRLARVDLPPNVRAVDFGIRGLDLAYALLDPPACLILVDAMARGDAPGTLTVLEPDLGALSEETAADAHAMDPVRVLALARSLGAVLGDVVVVGCEPEVLEMSAEGGLSEAVEAALPEAVVLIEELVARRLAEHSATQAE